MFIMLSPNQVEGLLRVLKKRFDDNIQRHKSIQWAKVESRLLESRAKLWSLQEMEQTGGEPDVIGWDKKSGEVIFYDCCLQTPKGRTSLCFDQAALQSRKANKPKGSAMAMAAEMGIELLTERQYRELQELGEFDTKTSSWIETPDDIRDLGGALFGDRRFGHVFVYHNGAESYYAARGFRGLIRI